MRDDQLERALQAEPDQHVRPDAQRRAGGARAGWRARSSSRVGQRSPLADQRRRRRACARPAPRTARGGSASPAYGAAVVVPVVEQLAALVVASSSGSAEMRALGVGDDAARAASAKCASMRAIVAASNRSVLYSTVGQRARPALPTRERRGRTCAVAGVDRRARLTRSARQAGARAPGAFCRAKHDLEERRVAEVALGLQLLDQLLEGHVLVGVGLRAPPRARARSSSRKVGSPDRSVRSTSVLTKNPISPSISARLRPAIGVPTTMSSCPCSASSSTWKAASSVMNSVAPSRWLTARFKRARVSCVRQMRRHLRAAVASARRGRGSVGRQLEHRGSSRELLAASRRAAAPAPRPAATRAARRRSPRTGSAARRAATVVAREKPS